MLTYLLSSTVSEFSHSKCQKSQYITTPLAFKFPDGGVPLERSPLNFLWMSMDGQGIVWWKTRPESAKTKRKTKLDMTAKFGRITHNNGHFAFRGHSRSPILVPIESPYTASYIKTIARQVLRIKSLKFTNLLEIYTLGVARSLCRRLQLDIVFVNCP